MSRKQKKRLGTVLTVIAVVIIVLVMDIGLITNFLTAFKSPFTISSSPPKWIFKPTLDNFRNVLGKGSFDFRLYLWNSFIIAVISSAIAIVLTIPAAYSIVRYHGFGDLILGSTMLLRLAPALAFAIPVFLIFNKFKMLDTKIAIIFMHTKLTPGVHISTDGAPGGYSIVDIDGTAFKWFYKATGRDASYQFRSYDRNRIEITPEKYVPNGNAAHKAALAQYTTSWAAQSSENYVYLNVWNYDPSWTVEITENGTPLTVKKLDSERDPLHVIAYTAKRLDSNASLNSDGTVNFDTGVNRHMFRAKASSATSTLEIKVTDRFGNVYTESMKRPKEFSTDAYKQ